MRRPVTAALTALLTCALLAACGGDPKPIFVSPSPSPTRPTTTTTTAASGPPVMPEAAKAHTKAGAIAFVKYYWDVVNYAQAALDASPLKPLQDGHCHECLGGERFIGDIAAKGGTIRGGAIQVTNARATRVHAATGWWFSVKFTTTSTPQKVDLPGTESDKSYTGGPETGNATLRPTSNGWQIDLLALS